MGGWGEGWKWKVRRVESEAGKGRGKRMEGELEDDGMKGCGRSWKGCGFQLCDVTC